MNFTYTFGAEWGEDDQQKGSDKSDDPEIVSAAVRKLLESAAQFKKSTETIERFCIPVLQASKSDIAIDQAFAGIIFRPHLTRMYLSYLASFAALPDVRRQLEKLIVGDSLVFDFQLMYVLGAALRCDKIGKDVINSVLRILDNRTIAQEVRAIAAIFAAKFGSAQQRRRVQLAYEGETSSYVRSAMLYASTYFTSAERSTCKKAWGGHSQLNELVSLSIP